MFRKKLIIFSKGGKRSPLLEKSHQNHFFYPSLKSEAFTGAQGDYFLTKVFLVIIVWIFSI